MVVCGHSGCGAMQAALDPAAAEEGPVADWMAHASPAIEAWRAGHPVGRAAAAAGEGEADQLSQVNVAVALDRLREVAGPGRDEVTFIGLWLRVSDGTVWMLQPGDNAAGGSGEVGFVRLTDAELQQLTSLL